MIEVQGLSRRYGTVHAVKDLSFSVPQGTVAGLLGPNGAGKTTTLRMLTGCLGAHAGTIRIGGHDLVAAPDAARAALGYLPEVPPLYLDMRVGAYLDHAARLRKVPAARRSEAVERALERADLTGVRRRLIGHLSKGYRQRVGIAQALVHEPAVLILDEPTSGLDPAQMGHVRSLLDALRGQHTILLSTHLLSEVTASCDTILILVGGRLVAAGTEDELRARLGGERRLRLHVCRDVEGCAARLAALEGVEVVSVRGSVVMLTLTGEGERRPEVHAIAAEHDLLQSSAEEGLEQLFARALHEGAVR